VGRGKPLDGIQRSAGRLRGDILIGRAAAQIDVVNETLEFGRGVRGDNPDIAVLHLAGEALRLRAVEIERDSRPGERKAACDEKPRKKNRQMAHRLSSWNGSCQNRSGFLARTLSSSRSTFTRTSCSILTLRLISIGLSGASILTVGWHAAAASAAPAATSHPARHPAHRAA